MIFPLFSSVARLEGFLGRGYPWVVVDTARLTELREAASFDEVVLDRALTVTGVED
ncbi:MAG: hypothetical protein GX344_09655 [Intrasporangiaceae bacterium]|nr:hypothetical protein [Intrasporangiaceae bacterium]